MTQLSSHSKMPDNLKGRWIGGSGSTNMLSIGQEKPVYNMTTDHLMGEKVFKEMAVAYIRSYLPTLNDVLLTKVLPLLNVTALLEVKWQEWLFDGDLASEVPEGTPSPLVNARSMQRTQGMQRRGVGAKMSLDVIGTAEGQRIWNEHQKSMMESFTNLFKLDIQREIFNNPYSQTVFQSYVHVASAVELPKILCEETGNFLIVARDVYGLKRLIDSVRKDMDDSGHSPNLVLLPSGTMRYVKNALNKTHQTVLQNGSSAIAYQNNYPYKPDVNDPNKTWDISGLPTYELSNVEEYQNSGPVNATESVRTIGRHFILSNGDAYVYDFKTDSMKRYSLKDSLKKCKIWNENGIGYSKTFGDWLTSGECPEDFPLKDISTFEEVANKDAAYAFLLIDVIGSEKLEKFRPLLRREMNLRESWEKMIDEGLPLPLNVLVLQPNIKLKTCSAAVIRGGPETGNTYISFEDYQTGISVETKVLIGNATLRSAAVVRQRRNITVIPNVLPSGFVSMGDEFYVPVRYDETATVKSCIDIKGTGMNFPMYSELHFKKYHEQFTYSTHALAELMYGINDLFPDAEIGKTYFSDAEVPNRLTFQTTQYCMDKQTKKFSRMISSRGHVPDKGNQPGSRYVFQGVKMFYDELNPEKILGYCP